MKYILDTNAVSALMRGDEPVVERLARVSRADVTVPQPVLAEISYGIERLPPSKRRQVLQHKFDLIRSQIGRREWTDEVSEVFATIKAGLERRGQRLDIF